MELLEQAPRILFGIGMIMHQLISAIIPGTALVLMVLSGFIYLTKSDKILHLFHLFLKLFIVQFSMALLSGILLDTGLSNFWPSLNGSLIKLVHHPFGRSAIISFVVCSSILYYLMKYKEMNNSSGRLIATLILFLSSFSLSLWSIIVNTLMQYPDAIVWMSPPNQNSLASISYSKLFSDSYLWSRLFHNYTASLIQGLSFGLFIIFFVVKMLPKLFPSYKAMIKLLFGILGFLLVFQPLMGHLQFLNIAKKQPTKAAAIEGYYNTTDQFNIYVIGKTNSEKEMTKGLKLPDNISSILIPNKSEITPLNDIPRKEWPNIERMFAGFHFMVVSWILMLLIYLTSIVSVSRYNEIKKTVLYSFLIFFIFSLLASLAGWLVSEAGRQPWIFYNLIRTDESYLKSGNIIELTIYLINNLLLPSIFLIFSVMFQRQIALNFINET